MGKGRLPEEAPADAGVQLKPVTLITPPEEVYSIPFSSINLMCISYLTGNFDQCDGMWLKEKIIITNSYTFLGICFPMEKRKK